MAKRRFRREREPDKLSLQCETIKFQVQEDRNVAVAKIDYHRHTPEDHKEFVVRMVAISIWMDIDSGNAIKAHLFANTTKVREHRSLVADIKTLGKMTVPYGQMQFTTDGNKQIRYGKGARDKFQTHSGDSSYSSIYYDSKAQAIADILQQIGRSKVIGGLNLVSLNRLPNSLLLELGYEEVPDLMKRRGISMWKGNPQEALGGNDYGMEAEKARKQFLEMLGRSINILPVSTTPDNTPPDNLSSE